MLFWGCFLWTRSYLISERVCSCVGGWLKALSGIYVINVVFICLITGGVVKGVVCVFKYVNWFFTH